MSGRTVTRRAALATAGAAAVAAPSFALALGAAGPDADLLRACERAVELLNETVRLWRARNAAKATLPERFSDMGIDPREWAYGDPLEGCERLAALSKEYLPHYLAAGLDSLHDQMEAVLEAQDPLMRRLMQAKPRTVAGALALARVWILEAGEKILVEEEPDDWQHKGVTAGLRAIDTAEAFATREGLA